VPRRAPEPSEHRTQQLHLVQALTEARALASQRGTGRWGELSARLDRILAVVGTDGGEVPDVPPPAGFDRIDRGAVTVDPAAADRLVATLGTLSDGPDAEPTEAVLRVVGELEAHLPRPRRRGRGS
jgi:hypothetical protein